MAQITSPPLRVRQSLVPPSEHHGLCVKCNAIDFKDVLARTKEYTSTNGSLVLELGEKTAALESLNCPLCCLFAAVRPNDIDEAGCPRSQVSYLHAFSNCNTWTGIDYGRECRGYGTTGLRSYEMTLLGVVRKKLDDEGDRITYDGLKESGYICPIYAPDLESHPGCRAILAGPETVNFGLLRRWIEHCEMNHEKTCQLEEQQSPSPFFRVIDCESRKVVAAPVNGKYTALSYVWGVPKSHLDNDCTDWATHSIPLRAPNVVEDAMSVTRNIGLRYIWVDRYCINQGDEQDKLTQIYQMDLIYSRAEVTIVAAAGIDPTFGLPGVEGGTRKARPHARVGNYLFATTLTDPVLQVKSSKWASRAWTYQEGVLSRRRLLFTEHQLIFECNTLICIETVDKALDAYSMGQKLSHTITSDYSCVFPFLHTRHNLLSYVADYSARKLTNESDVLNGIQGILRTFRKRSPPVYNLWGVPILPPQHMSMFPHQPRDLRSRSSIDGFIIGLCWDLRLSSKRRFGFPSWSWTGWIGEVSSGSAYYENSYGINSDISIWLELKDSSLMRFPDHKSLANLPDVSKLSNYIHIEAWTIKFRFEYLEPVPGDDEESDASGDLPYYRSGLYAKVALDSNCSSYSYFELTKATQKDDLLFKNLRTESWEGIVFGSLSEPSYGPCILVIESMGDHVERIRTFNLSPAIHSPEFCKVHPIAGGSPSICKKWNFQDLPKSRRRLRLG